MKKCICTLNIDLNYFLIGCCFKVSTNGLKFGKKSKLKKNDSLGILDTRSHNFLLSVTPGSHIYLVSGTPGRHNLPGSRELWLPGSWIPGLTTLGVLDAGESQLLSAKNTRGVMNLQCSGHWRVIFLLFRFFPNFKQFLLTLKQQH